ncbi:MAG: ParA family protein [Syntrophobacteraceae bacterium]
MKPIIAFANHKGGVGKTTSAVNIASVLGEMGKGVLVIDIDPQGSASLHFGVRDKGTGFLHALERTVAAPVIPTAVKGVDLIPSGPALSEAAQRFSGVLGAELLARCLARTQGAWELAIIDCPPGPGILTSSALRVSQHVVIPIETNRLALNGLDQLIETLDAMRRENLHPGILGLIACRANPRRRIHRETMAELERRFPGKMAPFVRENVALAEAPAQGKPVTLYASDSNGAEDYRRVTQWLLERLG